MTVIKINVDGEEGTLYIDGRLYETITNKVMPQVIKKDNDWVWIVDGGEGSGKSVFAQQLAKIIDPDFNLDRMCMTPEEFTKAVVTAKQKQCVVFDEAFTGLSSRQSLSEVNQLLVSMMMEMRQKNLFVIIVMPTFFLLDRYVALWRAKGLFHIYTKDGKRGRWVYFNRKKKNLLYLLGKKLYDYNKPKTKFFGRFYDIYTINEKSYRAKKKTALEQKSRTTKSGTFKKQRDKLLYMINKKLKVNQSKLAEICHEYEVNLDRSSINEIIQGLTKEMDN